ncbi:zinc finger and BTB domain-containing protein 24 isoform 2-T2 [Synchiropus picturatus]
MPENDMTSASFYFHSDAHKNGILGKFENLWKLELLCDVTLVVEDTHFRGHRALLAASSDFFSLMFTADPMGRSTYRLDGVLAEPFQLLLGFIYSAKVSVKESCVQQLLAAARLLQVSELIDWLTRLGNPTGDAGPSQSKDKGGRLKTSRGGHQARGRPTEGQLSNEEHQSEPECSGAAESRRRKRKVTLPLKYQAFSVGCEESETHARRKNLHKSDNRCDECGKVFKNHVLLRGHQMTHTGERPFRCSVCNKGFTQKHSLLVHQRIHTGEKPFMCSVCSKTLATKHSLKEHMNLHEGKKAFSCDKCEKTFTQKRQLKSHYKVHTGKALPECAECHRKFLDTAQLKKHLRTHTGEKPFTCEICGKCFSAKTTLQTHMRIHRGEKPFKCDICGKCFSDASARRRHVTSHSGKKPFSCSFCNLSFTRLDNLRTHALTHSKERSAAPPVGVEAGDVMPQFQLPHGSQQEVQLVVTADVDNIDFVATQSQEISIMDSDGGATQAAQSRLTLLAQGPNVDLVGPGDGSEGQQSEQMHVITLSKETMEHLQAHHGPPQQVQISQRALPLEHHNQTIHLSSGQPISISQTSQQLTGHHIQGQTFQIQAGTVSYLYTTGLPHT